MRAYASLRILAIHYRVHLLVGNNPPRRVPQSGRSALYRGRISATWPVARSMGPRPAAPCNVIEGLPKTLLSQPRDWAKAASLDIGNPFDVGQFEIAHVFRFYLTPLLDTLSKSVVVKTRQLDVDDIESLTRKRLAGLYALAGRRAAAAEADAEAALYEKLESERLPTFDRVFVGSSRDQEILLQRQRTSIAGVVA